MCFGNTMPQIMVMRYTESNAIISCLSDINEDRRTRSEADNYDTLNIPCGLFKNHLKNNFKYNIQSDLLMFTAIHSI